MERWIGKTAVVTGASSGIGAAISEKFVKLGINVVGIARRIHLLEKLEEKVAQFEENQTAKFYPYQCDVSIEENINKAFSWIEENLGGISIMVNNAGVYVPTTIINGDSNSWRKTTDLNLLSACICTKHAIKSMKTYQIDGQIINIGSIAGYYIPYVDPPVLNVYASSKHGLRAATETLRRELRYYKSNIRTTYIAPGFVATEFLAVDDSSNGEEMVNESIPMLKSEDIADICAFVLSTQPHCHLPEIIVRAIGEEI